MSLRLIFPMRNLAFTRASTLCVGRRWYSSSAPAKQEETEESARKATAPKKMQQARPSISKVGVPFAPFIPPRLSRFPNPATSPVLFGKCIFKWVYMMAYNTVQRFQFKRNMGKDYKPKYLKWKNDAVEDYIRINKAFSQKHVEKTRNLMSDYVFFALGKRQKAIPRTTSMGWDLIKLNEDIKQVNFNAIPHDDGSILLCQVIYRFDTKQRLVVKTKSSPKPQETVRDLVEYVAFNVDPYTDQVVLAGSVFESIPQRALSESAMPTQEQTLNSMVECGDIYRAEPSEKQKLAAVKK